MLRQTVGFTFLAIAARWEMDGLDTVNCDFCFGAPSLVSLSDRSQRLNLSPRELHKRHISDSGRAVPALQHKNLRNCVHNYCSRTAHSNRQSTQSLSQSTVVRLLLVNQE